MMVKRRWEKEKEEGKKGESRRVREGGRIKGWKEQEKNLEEEGILEYES